MHILVVDAQPLIHEAIRHLGRALGRGCTVFGALDPVQARRILVGLPAIDLAIVDLPADGESWQLALLAEMHAERPELPILALGASDDRASVTGAVASGASGFVVKSQGPAVLMAAVQRLVDGGIHLPAGALGCAERVPAGAPRRTRNRDPIGFGVGLTLRQSEVLALIAEGKPNKLICRELSLSEGTVKVHVSAVLRALNVDNRTQAALAAARLGVPLPARPRPARDERPKKMPPEAGGTAQGSGIRLRGELG